MLNPFADIEKARLEEKKRGEEEESRRLKAHQNLRALQRPKYEELKDMVCRILEKLREAIGWGPNMGGFYGSKGAHVSGGFDPLPSNFSGNWREKAVKTVARWELWLRSGGFMVAAVELQADNNGIPTHFRVAKYSSPIGQTNTEDLSQGSLVEAIKELWQEKK